MQPPEREMLYPQSQKGTIKGKQNLALAVAIKSMSPPSKRTY
jgi:hypothetical protein